MAHGHYPVLRPVLAAAALDDLPSAPSSEPTLAPGITPATPLLWADPTTLSPYLRLASPAGWRLAYAATGFSQVPMSTVRIPAMASDPGMSLSCSPFTHAAILASGSQNPWPCAIMSISGLNTFTCVMADIHLSFGLA